MDNVQVILSLPADLVDRAKNAGVLENDRMVQLIESELKRQADAARLRADVEKLRATADAMTDEEIADLIEAEIKAYRAEKRQP